MPDYRSRAAVIQRDQAEQWYRVENKADGRATIRIFDEIGFFGVSAKQFVDELDALDVSRIELHINSPGGEVFDAIAIRNALRAHPAKVTAVVDGMAASSASFIALAGDEVVMGRNSEMMIHDAFGLVVGNAEDMADAAARLVQVSDNIASMYAEKAGGTVADWRALMRAETWYSAQEAVDAGLADRVAPEVAEVKNRFDLSIFNYAGRASAPDPQTPTSDPVEVAEVPPVTDVAGSNQLEGAGRMDQAKLREALGLNTDASDEEVRSALGAAGFSTPQPADKAPESKDMSSDQLRKIADAAGAVIVDKGVWDEAQAKIQQGVDAAKKLREQERDVLLNAAVSDGRIPPASKQTWANLYDTDPKGTGEVIAKLRKNHVPVAELGYATDDPDDLGDFAGLFPKER